MERLLDPVKRVRGFLILYVGLHALAVLALSYFIITMSVVRPIDRLRAAAVRLGEGRFEAEPGPGSGAREMHDLGRALAQTAAKLAAQQSALRSHIRDLEKAQVELKAQQDAVVRSEKLASVGRLAAGVAHEIGNPLAVILGFLEILKGGAVTATERDEYLARMQGEAERMNRIVKDLLSYARPGRQEPGAVDVRASVEQALAVLKPQRVMRGIAVKVAAEDGVPAVVATSDRMTQVFVNLVLNAAEAMVGEGNLSVSISKGGGGEVVVRVEDDGPGIDAAVLPVIFEPFVTTKPESQGTGLGLAVCHNIVTGFGGSITARNREGGGACFEVRLPGVTPRP
jgi:signal transduction histidine kinase